MISHIIDIFHEPSEKGVLNENERQVEFYFEL